MFSYASEIVSIGTVSTAVNNAFCCVSICFKMCSSFFIFFNNSMYFNNPFVEMELMPFGAIFHDFHFRIHSNVCLFSQHSSHMYCCKHPGHRNINTVMFCLLQFKQFVCFNCTCFGGLMIDCDEIPCTDSTHALKYCC